MCASLEPPGPSVNGRKPSRTHHRRRWWDIRSGSARSPCRPGSARPPSTGCCTTGPGCGRARRARCARRSPTWSASGPAAHRWPHLRRRSRHAGTGPVLLRRPVRARGRAARAASRRRSGPDSTFARQARWTSSSPPWTRSPARGSHGVLLKAPDVPEIVAAVDRLVAAGIPVVTLVTDLPSSRRAGVRGHRQPGRRRHGRLPHRSSGSVTGQETCWSPSAAGSFRGEEEREMGFRATMRGRGPGPSLVDITDTDGLDETMRHLVRAALEAAPGPRRPSTPSAGATARSSRPSPCWTASAGVRRA